MQHGMSSGYDACMHVSIHGACPVSGESYMRSARRVPLSHSHWLLVGSSGATARDTLSVTHARRHAWCECGHVQGSGSSFAAPAVVVHAALKPSSAKGGLKKEKDGGRMGKGRGSVRTARD
eukprot:scaffold16903_cov133-Isochrysis_galbana.AAC.7